MSFEFDPSKRASPEDEPSLEQLMEEVKAEIRSKDPERFALFEKFLAVDTKTLRLLPVNLQERYGELEEDWFNISDVCDRMGGEEKYQKILVDIERALVERKQKISDLKKRIPEVGEERLCAYFDMCQAEDGTDVVYERGLFKMLEASKNQGVLDKYPAELVDRIADEVKSIDIAVIDQWIERQKINARQAETKRLKSEKMRVIQWLQKMRGSEWKLIVTLCQRLDLVKEAPKNGEMLNQLQPEQLLDLEKRYHAVEKKLREYDMDLWNSSDEDLAVVLDEVLQSGI